MDESLKGLIYLHSWMKYSLRKEMYYIELKNNLKIKSYIDIFLLLESYNKNFIFKIMFILHKNIKKLKKIQFQFLIFLPDTLYPHFIFEIQDFSRKF